MTRRIRWGHASGSWRLRPSAILGSSAVLMAMVAVSMPAAQAAATTVYVGTQSCSDAGPGTSPTAPFCTIAAALAVTQPGGSVIVTAGTYPGDVKFPRSGLAGAPISLVGQPGATVLSGGVNGVAISSRSYINVSGISTTGTQGAGIYLSSSSQLTISSNHVSYAGVIGQRGSTSQGIYLNKVTDSQISGNQVDHASDAGIYLTNGSTRDLISGNTSSWNAFGYVRNAPGIDLRSPGNAVIGNVVHDNEDTGIQLYTGANNNLVADNLSYHNKGFTTVVLDNCNHPKTGNTAGCITGDHGIDDFNVSGNTIVGNTVYDNVAAGINAEASKPALSGGFTIENNISVDNAINCPDGAGGFTSCPRTSGDIRVDSSSQTGTTVNDNLVYLHGAGTLYTWGVTTYKTLAAFQAASGQESRGIVADPDWVSPASANFALTEGSPAIDSANSTVTGEQTVDLLGAPRVDDPLTPNGAFGFDDRGAFEYQPSEAPPPSVPAPPVLSATAGTNVVDLSWTVPDNGGAPITGYSIYQGAAAGAEGATPLATVPAGVTTFQDTTAPAGAAAYYVVTATNAVGSSGVSNEVSATPAAPGPPANLVGNPGFETGVTGWNSGAGTTLARETATVHSGAGAAAVTLTTAGNDTLLNDSPDWNRSAIANTTCTATAWVQGPANPTNALTAKIRLRQYAGTTNVSTVIGTITLAATPSWQLVSISAPVASPGADIDLNVYGKGFAVGQALLIDDVTEICQ